MPGEKNVTFMVAGSAKCGTTSMYHYLQQHPQIEIPALKESMFFISSVYEKFGQDDPAGMRKVIFDSEGFWRLFPKKENSKAAGEVGTFYLYYHNIAIPKIKETLGDIKIIAILRNPVDRAYSAYSYLKRDYLETLTFEDALKEEGKRKEKNWDAMWYYRDLGYYFEQIKAYKKNFSNVKILLYEDFIDNPGGIIKDCFEFIGVDSSFKPDTTAHFNQSGIYKSRLLYNLFQKPNFLKSMARPVIRRVLNEKRRSMVSNYLLRLSLGGKRKLREETREILEKLYREDVLKLQDLLGKNLSSWVGNKR